MGIFFGVCLICPIFFVTVDAGAESMQQEKLGVLLHQPPIHRDVDPI